PLGTRQYMAPEQTLGSKAEYGPTCDVWGIGVILYEMLAGRRPYIADDPVELYQQIREHPPPPCAEFNPAVPPGVEAIARKCLEKDPAARYSTAEEVAEDLERWLGGEAITLPADTPQLTPRPARRYLRRRWLWVALAAVLLLTAGSVFALRPWERTPETTPPPPPPPERSIAERYRAGETVVLIGDTGMPLFPHTDVDDRHGFFAPGPEGCSAYSAVSLGMTELVSEDLPLPIRLELEVAMQPSQNGYGGFYLVRKAWPGPNGPHTSMVWVRMQSRSRLAVMHVQPIQEDAEIGVNWRGRRGSETISTPTSPIGAWNDGFLSPFPIPRPLRWHRVAVVITADEVQVTWDGKPFTPPNRRRPSANVGQADVLDHVKSMARGTWPGVPPDYLPPAFGPGIGVYAQQCVIAFRNVRLVPPVR
ncbi:MAG TPA: protein kinase, partial [Gemmataceae bacterium]|nr:protein kinase [Gemmataceae bacterium]